MKNIFRNFLYALVVIMGLIVFPYSVFASNGACNLGTNGEYFLVAPATNLCGNGMPTAVTGTGPWTWNCESSGGTTASCVAQKIDTSDVTPPEVTTQITNITPTTATISWTTNEPANCNVYVGSTGFSSGNSIHTYELSGQVTLDGSGPNYGPTADPVTPATTYEFNMRCLDPNGNYLSGPTQSFDTPPLAPQFFTDGAGPAFPATGGAVGFFDVAPGAVIHYTTDGSNPTASSTVYATNPSTSIIISADTTIKAIAVRNGAISAVATATYTITGPPLITNGLPTGMIDVGTTTTLSVNTNEASTCRYSRTALTPFANMTNFYTTGGTSHSKNVTYAATSTADVNFGPGLNNFYVKCKETNGGEISDDYLISFTEPTSTKDFTSFSVDGNPAEIGANYINGDYRYGANNSCIVVTFVITGASVTHNGDPMGSGACLDFRYPITLTVHASDGSTKNYSVYAGMLQNSAKEITAFRLSNGSNGGTFYNGVIVGNVISVAVPQGYAVTALGAIFTNSTGSSVSIGAVPQVSGSTLNDFTSSVIYTVKAADESTQNYTVNVVDEGTFKDITAFSFGGLSPAVVGSIGQDSVSSQYRINLTVPSRTDVSSLVATYTTNGNNNAVVRVGGVTQISGATFNNFTSPLTYAVTAGDGTTRNYVVIVSIAGSTKSINSFSFSSPNTSGIIDYVNKTITLTVPHSTNVTNLVATFEHDGASVKVGTASQTSGVTPNNFTNPVSYIVTAEDSSTQTFVVTVTVTPAAQVIAPSASLAAGTYSSTQSTTLTSGTAGAAIYYTTNGTTPTASSTHYVSAISINSTVTLKAIAIKSGMTDSTVTSNLYTITAADQVIAPVASLAAGTFSSTQSTTLTSGTAGAAIYYTTNGTTPTANSTHYISAISISSTVTLKAIAIKSGMTDSTVMSRTYTITPADQVIAPTATFNSFETTDTTPQINGTYSGSPVGIIVYIGTNSYYATINGNGTWVLEDNRIISALDLATYTVRIRAFDVTGNTSDSYTNLRIFSESKSSDTKKSSKDTKKTRQVKVSKKSVKNGDIIVESGKNFSKKSKVLLYFQRNDGSYYPPKVLITDSKGSFSLKYTVNKPKGIYSWFAQDYRSGKKVWSKFRVN